MDAKKFVLLIGSLVIAIATALLARNMLSPSTTPQVSAASMPEANLPHVLVATKALPVGTIVDAESFRFQPWPKDLVEEAYFIEGKVDITKLTGSVVRNAITAGQPITQGTLVQPGDRGFLAAALGAGMRAVTVPVQAQTSVAGFVFPGDHVDIVLTQTVNGGGDGEPLKVSETILRNVRVLATDQRTDVLDEAGKPVVQAYSNVTLEVTPKIAEKIAVAQTVGSLSLSLRSLADTTSDLDAAIAGTDVDLDDGTNGKNEKKMLARIAARPVDRGSTYSTGADVSRYQRSSVPAKPVNDATASAGSPTGGAPAVIQGPVVRIARGTEVTAVSVGGK